MPARGSFGYDVPVSGYAVITIRNTKNELKKTFSCLSMPVHGNVGHFASKVSGGFLLEFAYDDGAFAKK